MEPGTDPDDTRKSEDAEALVADLQRWEDSGAVWRVVHRAPGEVTVALLRCDGGEEVGRLSGGGSAWLGLLEGREGSDD
ncbi:hypothetical protein G7072_14085 [Nocardioides sp. HDW12B]|uniref:hypothetical protein n=1 Tax=Nocardioides sp. HDW12B TaxID=2714939 RepID=UPI00140C9A2C|nr:hypothetical protein [Nocardioides sp. HDW12B]QIK67328.1 hypothetical protein G7072_14085 [Nocardioides sp. HDW12B]